MNRVLHINDYSLDAGGGAEVVVRTTIDLLRAQGFTVEVFTSADLADARRTAWRYVSNRHACRALAARLEAFRPDVVHLHNYYHVLSPAILDTLAAYRRRTPLRVVMTAHDYHLACPDSGGSWFRWWTGRREAIEPGPKSLGSLWGRRWDQRSSVHSLLKLVQHTWNYRWHHRHQVIDLVICPSRFVQSMLAPLGMTTCLLPHPVAALPMNTLARGPHLRFIFAGRIEPEKGLRELLEEWPLDLPASLTVVGDGSQIGPCRTICAERGLADRIEFVGRLPHAQTLERIASCHVLIQPSRVLETYGLTLIEALASGTNILAADRGAAREIVESAGVGYLYGLDDRQNLLDRLQSIRRTHEVDRLNRFDVGTFLLARSGARHVDQLVQIYQRNAAASTCAERSAA